MPSPYKSNQYLTNSKLSAFANKISGREIPDSKNAYRLGTLHDAYITNPATINHFERSITTRYGEKYFYSAQEMKEANDMHKAFFDHPFCSRIWKESNLQEVVYNEGVDFEGLVMQCACTCDGRIKHSRKPWDLKRTAATSLAAFTDAFYSFDYDRQGYFYLQTCESNWMPFFGQSSKKPYQVFTIVVEPGNDFYESGREKTIDLLMRYDILSELL